ncbi:MAG: hypothetical protein WKG07_37465 [Hymenobacter sp.]
MDRCTIRCARTGKKPIDFRASDSISTYLFSFAAGKFTPVRRTVGVGK